MSFLITSTGLEPSSPSKLVFPEWGARTFLHPVTDFDIEPEFTITEIRDSQSMRTYLDNGYVTANYNGNIITTSAQLIAAIDGAGFDDTIGLIIALGGI